MQGVTLDEADPGVPMVAAVATINQRVESAIRRLRSLIERLEV